MCPAFWLCQTKLLETGRATFQCLWIKKHSPFSYFKTNPPFIPLATLVPLKAQQGLGVGLGWLCGANDAINVLDKEA